MLKGLTDEQVQESRLKYGSNVIEEAEPETFLDKVKGQLGDPMIKLLIAIAVIMGMLAVIGHGDWLEVAGIVFSVALVTFISARTELASDSEYRKLKTINVQNYFQLISSYKIPMQKEKTLTQILV